MKIEPRDYLSMELTNLFMEDHIRMDVWDRIDNWHKEECADVIKNLTDIYGDDDHTLDFLADDIARKYLSGKDLPDHCSYYVMLDKLIIEWCYEHFKENELELE